MATKKFIPVLVAFLAGCGGAVTAIAVSNTLIAQEYVADNNGPYELIVRNTSSGPSAMTEVRTINESGCAADLTTMGDHYNNPSDTTATRNEAGLITESPCKNMMLKSNAGFIRVHTHEAWKCPYYYDPPHMGSAFCTDQNGSLWAISQRGNRALVVQ